MTSCGQVAVRHGHDYDIRLFGRASRDLKKLPDVDYDRIDARLLGLSVDPRPHGAKKLTNDTYRIRVGPWRVIYLVDDPARAVVILAVRRRNEDTYHGF